MKHLFLKSCIIAISGLVINSCAALGFKSTPWPNYTPVHDEKAVNFIRNVPSVKSGLVNKDNATKNYAANDKQVIGVSVSGGGMRAAAYTLGVLEGLEELKLLDNVDFISSNSGGGWGVAAYIADKVKSTDQENYRLASRRESLSAQFENMSKKKVKCLPSAVEKNLTHGLSYGDIYKQNNQGIPDHFINAALLPSETGFVFTKESLRYFRVSSMDACKESEYPPIIIDTSDSYSRSLEKLSYGYAAATSGSVPLFYSSTAKTSMCSQGSDMYDSSFCSLGYNNDSELHIVDGGIHDNHAYKSAIEIFSNYQNTGNSCREENGIKCRLIIIDSTTNIISPLISQKENKDRKLAFGFGTGSGFTGQDATAARIRNQVFDALGTETNLLDFFAAANLEDVDFLNLDDDVRFDGLTHLKSFITHKASCFANDGKIIKADFNGVNSEDAKNRLKLRSQSDDCKRNNVYRAGTIAKTTYDYDKKAGMFPVLWDLGIFVTRQLKEDLIAEAP